MEGRQAGQGLWGLSNNMVVSSLICFHFFNLMYPRLGANEASNPEIPKGTDKKGPRENLLSLAKDEDKSSLTRQKQSDNDCCAPARPWENWPVQQRPSEAQTFSLARL